MFEIKYKDAMARMGTLKTPHGKIKTPALMPVIHPGKQTLDVKKYGAELVITNAYIIYKNDELKEKALSDGVHELIDFSGPVITDSGSFQLSEYGDIEVSNKEIIEFQELIGTDIGTSLDIPTPPFVSKEIAEKDLKITLERAKEALDIRENLMLNSVVQGSTHLDLRSYCADVLGKMNFDVYPIGAVVPLLESYQYSQVVDVVMASVTHLPSSKPRHLMGAGHPMVFSLAVALGCDLFDSAAYILYAENDRIMMPNGTYKLENLIEMPCSCKVCTSYTPDDLRSMQKSERSKLIAQHNLNISFAEIRAIKQSIVDGSLLELVEQRCRSHPNLLNALRKLKDYVSVIDEYDPANKKSAFFYSGSESVNRPEVFRHQKRLNRLQKSDRLLLLPKTKKPYHKYISNQLGTLLWKINDDKLVSSTDIDVAVVDIPFGIIPLEIDEVYPLAQNESPSIRDYDSINFVSKFVEKYIEEYHEIIVSKEVVDTFNLDFIQEYMKKEEFDIIKDDNYRIKRIADYQFGSQTGDLLFNGDIIIEKSRKTGKIRHIFDGKELIATLRASDGIFVLSSEGARRLHKGLDYPKNRVVINDDAEPFALEGKSIFAKFVIDCDKNI
ncbi:MAG: tRNA guanosine(15) transglycosylase TgtA, partial [Methanobacteriaceae archaeon]|nr:tRNA guanosine(15) transglycosylase TgtA [Methanobacteriaceae archaeon]